MPIGRSENHPQVEEKGILRYPPPSVAPRVRHIRWLTASLADSLDLQKLTLLTRLADGTTGFKNLESVSININSNNNNNMSDGDRHTFKQQLQALTKIEFPTRFLRIESVTHSDDDATIVDLELPLLEKIDVKGDSPYEECWHRFYW
jgi:hypothetical protein